MTSLVENQTSHTYIPIKLTIKINTIFNASFRTLEDFKNTVDDLVTFLVNLVYMT